MKLLDLIKGPDNVVLNPYNCHENHAGEWQLRRNPTVTRYCLATAYHICYPNADESASSILYSWLSSQGHTTCTSFLKAEGYNGIVRLAAALNI